MKGQTSRATAILIGTTIGAGIFGLPYAVAQVGFVTGIIYLLALGVIVLLLNLIYGEVILRTPGDHQLTGYGEIYLGQLGKLLASLALLVGLYGALWVYLLKIGGFLALFTSPAGEQPPNLLFSLGFFCLASVAILAGLRAVSFLELILVSLMLLFIFTLAAVGLPHLSSTNFQFSIFNFQFAFFPYGIILFALTGYSAIPEMEEVLRDKRTELKKAIFIGTAIPVLVYLIFVTVIIGISGRLTSEDAISGLRLFLPNWIVRLGAGLGILTMSTSFLSLGYVLREAWLRDFKLPKTSAFILALLPPLLLFLLGTKSFLTILEYTGAFTGGLSGLLIIAMAYRLKQPKWLLRILAFIFLLGMLTPFF